MSSNLLARIPGSPAWVRATFTPRVQLKIRDELRPLERATGALAAVVWLPDAADGEWIAFTGDLRAVPHRFPRADETVPTPYRIIVNGEASELVAQIVQLGRGLPSLRVATVAPELTAPPTFEALCEAAVRIERIVVRTLRD